MRKNTFPLKTGYFSLFSGRNFFRVL